MRWERYYAEREIRPFTAQVPFYRYYLECFGQNIEASLAPEQPVRVLMGGINPIATKPSDLTELAKTIFPERDVETMVVDQNEEALSRIEEESFQPILADLTKLPPEVNSLHLVVCDFTLDFMTDLQVREFGKVLAERLAKDGVLLVSGAEYAFNALRELENKLKYGLSQHFRTSGKLIRLLDSLKPVAVAEAQIKYTHRSALERQPSLVYAFARPDSSYERSTGLLGLVDDENPHFGSWLHARGYGR